MFLLVVLSLFLLAATGQQPSPAVVLSQDFIQCIEKGECGLHSVCQFRFFQHHLAQSNDPSVTFESAVCKDFKPGVSKPPPPPPPGTRVPSVSTEPSLQSLCTPLVEGYIFTIANEMDYSMDFTWDILDRDEVRSDALTPVVEGPRRGRVKVPAKSVRYFSDGIFGTHTVRLYVGLDFVDEVLALNSKQCTTDDACDFLFYLCHQDRDLGTNDTAVCTVYGKECQGFSKRRSDRERDLRQYLLTHFSKYFNGPNGQQTIDSIRSEDFLEFLTLSPDFRKFKAQTGNKIRPLQTDTSTSNTAAFVVAIVILSLVIVAMIVLMFCFTKYCTPGLRARMGFVEETEKYETLSGNVDRPMEDTTSPSSKRPPSPIAKTVEPKKQVASGGMFLF